MIIYKEFFHTSSPIRILLKLQHIYKIILWRMNISFGEHGMFFHPVLFFIIR